MLFRKNRVDKRTSIDKRESDLERQLDSFEAGARDELQPATARVNVESQYDTKTRIHHMETRDVFDVSARIRGDPSAGITA